MKNISAMLISIIILTMIGGMALASGIDSLYVGGATQGSNGDNVNIFINTTNANNIGNLAIDLLFDKNVMVANSAIEGSLITGSTFTYDINNNTGNIAIDVVNLSGISGNGTIAKISFNVVGSEGNSSRLNISVTNITDPDNNQIIPQNITNSTFEIISSAPTTTTSISGTAGENGWYISNVAVTLTAIDHSGLGINKTQYIINDMPPNTYKTPFGITNDGVTMVDYYSIDNSGITEATKELTVKIDKNKPTIIAPANITTNATGQLTHINIGIPIVNDTVDPNPNITNNAPTGDLFSIGNVAVIWNAIDEAGNANMAVQYINVLGPDYPFISDFNVTPNTHISNTNPAIASATINKSKDDINEVDFGIVDTNNLTGDDMSVLVVYKNFSGAEGLYNTEPWNGNYAVIGNMAISDIGNITASNIVNMVLPDIGNMSISDIGNMAISDIGNMSISDIGNMAISDIGNMAISDIGNMAISDIGNIAVSGPITIDQESDAPEHILVRGLFKGNDTDNGTEAMLWFNKTTGIMSNITNLITEGGIPLHINEGNSTFQTEIYKYVNGLNNSPEYVTGNGNIFILYDIKGNLRGANPRIMSVQVPNGNYKVYVNARDTNGDITKFVDIDTIPVQISTGGGGSRGGGSSGGFNSQGNGTYRTNRTPILTPMPTPTERRPTVISTPVTTIPEQAVPKKTAVPAPTKKSPGFEIVIAIGTILTIYIYRRMGR